MSKWRLNDHNSGNSSILFFLKNLLKYQLHTNFNYKTCNLNSKSIEDIFEKKVNNVLNENLMNQDFFQLFINLKYQFENRLEDELSQTMNTISNITYNLNELPKNFQSFFLENNFIYIFLELIKTPKKMNEFYDTIDTITNLFSIPISDKNEYIPLQFIENGILDVLLSIRQFIDEKCMPSYIHTIGNICYYNESERNKVLMHFPPNLLDDLLSIPNQEINNEAAFLIKRFTNYRFRCDDFSDFPSWVVSYFVSHFSYLSDQVIYFFLEAISNLGFYNEKFHNDFFLNLLFSPEINFNNILENFISNVLSFNECQQYDGLIHMILRIYRNGVKNNCTCLLKIINIQLLLEIAKKFYDLNKSSVSSIKLLTCMLMSSNSHPADILQNIENLKKLLDIYQKSNFFMKDRVKDLFIAICKSCDPSNLSRIGNFLITTLFEFVFDIDESSAIRDALWAIDDILVYGDSQYSDNIFQNAMIECEGINYLLRIINEDQNDEIYLPASSILDHFPKLMNDSE